MTRRASLILLELMAAILFFALAGSVCVSILVKADTLSREARDQTQAARAVTSAAELIRGADSDAAALTALFSFWPQAQGQEEVTIPLDGGILTVTREFSGPITRYHIQYTGGVSLQLTLDRFYGEVDP